MRWLLYLRISDDREGGGLGVARQEADCRDLAERLGGTIVHVYIDNDISAASGRRRPEYQRMLTDLRNGVGNGVIAWHTDRLHRTPKELETYIDLADTHGFTTETVKAGTFDLRTPSGRAVARTLCAWARYEVEHNRERIRRKAEELALAGKVGNGGPRPFGYEKDRTTVRTDEARIIRDLARRVLAGETLRALCLDLESRGIRTTQGNAWTTPALRYLLTCHRIAGWREHHGQPVARAVWPAILDDDTANRVRAVLLDPARRTSQHGNVTYLLTGLLRCGLCGAKLSPARTRTSQRFGCRPAPEDGCGRILIRYDHVEAFVDELVRRRLADLAVTPPADGDDPTVAMLAAIAQDERRIIALADAFADDHDTSPLEMRHATRKIQQRIDENRSKIAAIYRNQAVADPQHIADMWPTLPFDRRRAVVLRLIDRIDIHPAVRGRTTFDPNRVSVTWR